jgi:hypothetical protein
VTESSDDENQVFSQSEIVNHQSATTLSKISFSFISPNRILNVKFN